MNPGRINALIGAAAKIDRNSGYQPCFHLNENGSFCGNSHGEEHLGHRHVSFADLLREVAKNGEHPFLRTEDLIKQLEDQGQRIHELEARLRELAGSGWQEIETAPRDGTWILIPFGDMAIPAYYCSINSCWETGIDDLKGACPTLWMPMPELPEPKRRKAEEEK